MDWLVFLRFAVWKRVKKIYFAAIFKPIRADWKWSFNVSFDWPNLMLEIDKIWWRNETKTKKWWILLFSLISFLTQQKLKFLIELRDQLIKYLCEEWNLFWLVCSKPAGHFFLPFLLNARHNKSVHGSFLFFFLLLYHKCLAEYPIIFCQIDCCKTLAFVMSQCPSAFFPC